MSKSGVAGIAVVFAATAVAAASANASDKTLKVTNATRKTVVNVYLTPLSCNDDYGDALGDRLIWPGKSEIVDVQSDCGCRYNLRFVFKDQTVIDRYDVDICKNPAYRVTDR